MPAWKDLTGKKFGSLTVIKYLGKSLWLCECDCGREKPKNNTHDLKRDNPKCRKCGDEESGKKRRIKGIIGKTWGTWRVTKELHEKDSKGSWLYEIRCNCGVIKKASGGAINACLKNPKNWSTCRKCADKNIGEKANITKEKKRVERSILYREKLRGEVPEEWFNLPITDKDAIKKGEKIYFSGVPCQVAGHIHPRRVNQGCPLCAEVRSPKYERTPARMKRRREMTALYRATPNGKVTSNLRGRIFEALKKYKDGIKLKRLKTQSLLDCSFEELVSHLESNFIEEMSWDNYGEWELDHIRPCASFNLVEEEQQKVCFNWRNLYPLWKKDNRSKSASYKKNDEIKWAKIMIDFGFKGNLFLKY